MWTSPGLSGRAAGPGRREAQWKEVAGLCPSEGACEAEVSPAEGASGQICLQPGRPGLGTVTRATQCDLRLGSCPELTARAPNHRLEHRPWTQRQAPPGRTPCCLQSWPGVSRRHRPRPARESALPTCGRGLAPCAGQGPRGLVWPLPTPTAVWRRLPHRAPRSKLLGLSLVWAEPDVSPLPTFPAAGCSRATKFWPMARWQSFPEPPQEPAAVSSTVSGTGNVPAAAR